MKTKTKLFFIRLTSLCLVFALCLAMLFTSVPVAYAAENDYEKITLSLNSNENKSKTIDLYEFDSVYYITIDDLCSLTRCTASMDGNVITVTQGFWCTEFNVEKQTFTDSCQVVDTIILKTSRNEYAVPALVFLEYFKATAYVADGILFCITPEFTAWEALNVDYSSSMVDIYELYGGEGKVTFSLFCDILMDFILSGTPNSDDYLIDAFNAALSVNLYDSEAIHNYQEESNESFYNYLISDDGQQTVNYVNTLLDGSISGIEYLCETYYDTINIKFADLVENSYSAGLLDESTHYAAQILNGYRKKTTISSLAEKSKIPLTQVAPVIIQTALESAQQLKYAAATNNIVYGVMGSESICDLGLDVADNDWFRIANTFKNTESVVVNNFLGNAVDSFSNMGWNQLIGDCVKGFTGTSAGLFLFSKECATAFAKWFPLTGSSIKAFESDRLALYLSELQQNVFLVVRSTFLKFDGNFDDLELYERYIQAEQLYCRTSIAMYKHLITMVNEFGKNRDYWMSLFQEQIDQLSVSLYQLTMIQDDRLDECLPLDLSAFTLQNNASEPFAFLPRRFDEYGSAHSMYSGVNLNPDGTFTCEMMVVFPGGDGSADIDGTGTISKYSGKFSDLTQINELTYKMTLEHIEQLDQVGREYVEDRIKFVVDDWNRFEGVTEAYIYLPGTKYTIQDGCYVSTGGKELFYIGPYYSDLEDILENGCVLYMENMPAFISEPLVIKTPENANEESSSSNILESTLGFTKAWDIHEDYNGEQIVTTYAFREDGTYYSMQGFYLSECFGYIQGTYEIAENEISLFFEEGGNNRTISYEINRQEMTFTQTSDVGLYPDHVRGQVFDLEENPWYTGADVKNQVDTYG